MDDALGMGVPDGVTNLLENVEQNGEGVLLYKQGAAFAEAVKNVAESDAADVFHGVKIPALGIDAEVVDRDDVGVAQAAKDKGFLDKPAREAGIAGHLRGQDLDGDGTLEVAVAGLGDLAHATLGKEFADFVAFAGGQCGGGRRDGRRSRRIGAGGVEGGDLELGAANVEGLARLEGLAADDLLVIDKGAVTSTGVFDLNLAVGEDEPGVFAGDLGAVHVDGTGGVTADEIIAGRKGDAGDSRAIALRDHLNGLQRFWVHPSSSRWRKADGCGKCNENGMICRVFSVWSAGFGLH